MRFCDSAVSPVYSQTGPALSTFQQVGFYGVPDQLPVNPCRFVNRKQPFQATIQPSSRSPHCSKTSIFYLLHIRPIGIEAHREIVHYLHELLLTGRRHYCPREARTDYATPHVVTSAGRKLLYFKIKAPPRKGITGYTGCTCYGGCFVTSTQ